MPPPRDDLLLRLATDPRAPAPRCPRPAASCTAPRDRLAGARSGELRSPTAPDLDRRQAGLEAAVTLLGVSLEAPARSGRPPAGCSGPLRWARRTAPRPRRAGS